MLHTQNQTSEDELEVALKPHLFKFHAYPNALGNNRISKFKVPVNPVLDHAFGCTKSRSLSGVLGHDQSFANHSKDHSDKFDKSNKYLTKPHKIVYFNTSYNAHWRAHNEYRNRNCSAVNLQKRSKDLPLLATSMRFAQSPACSSTSPNGIVRR